jgi:hypothetical protein
MAQKNLKTTWQKLKDVLPSGTWSDLKPSALTTTQQELVSQLLSPLVEFFTAERRFKEATLPGYKDALTNMGSFNQKVGNYLCVYVCNNTPSKNLRGNGNTLDKIRDYGRRTHDDLLGEILPSVIDANYVIRNKKSSAHPLLDPLRIDVSASLVNAVWIYTYYFDAMVTTHNRNNKPPFSSHNVRFFLNLKNFLDAFLKSRTPLDIPKIDWMGSLRDTVVKVLQSDYARRNQGLTIPEVGEVLTYNDIPYNAKKLNTLLYNLSKRVSEKTYKFGQLAFFIYPEK